jgi:glutaredoxin
MNKKTLVSAVLLIAVLVAGIFILKNNKEPETIVGSEIVLYYGEGCPHCKIVDEYIAENNVEQKIQFVKKEVWFNQKNALELGEKAKTCGLPTNSIGVPFLWDGGKCLIGDQEIINFFKEKINVQ